MMLQQNEEYKHLQRVRVSIGGNEKVNDAIRGDGTYSKAMKAIKLLCIYDIPCVVNYTITKKTISL